jgi:hypothetical protein
VRYPAFLLLVSIAIAQTSTGKPSAKPGPRVSTAFQASAQIAYDSIKSLSPQKEASDVAFQPRQIEVEKNLAAAGHRVKTDEDKREFAILKSWADMIDLYRSTIKSEGLNQRVLDIFKVEMTCFTESVLIFDRDSLSAHEREKAKTTHCVDDATSVTAEIYPTPQ